MKFPAMERAEEVLKRLPDGEVFGAEIGVFRGAMSSFLLSRPDLRLCMVDNWRETPMGYHGHYPTDPKVNMAAAIERTDFASQRRLVLHMDSVEAAKCLEDEALDFVFIDADHSYEGVKSDIEAWRKKIKPGGILCGHDYDNPSDPWGKDVKRAVDESVPGVTLGRQTTWFTRV